MGGINNFKGTTAIFALAILPTDHRSSASYLHSGLVNKVMKQKISYLSNIVILDNMDALLESIQLV